MSDFYIFWIQHFARPLAVEGIIDWHQRRYTSRYARLRDKRRERKAARNQ